MKYFAFDLMFCCCKKRIQPVSNSVSQRLSGSSEIKVACSDISPGVNNNSTLNMPNFACTLCSLPLDRNMKKLCPNCKGCYCITCMTGQYSTANTICPNCRIIMQSSCKDDLMRLKVRYLLMYMEANHISADTCKEKEDLVNMILIDRRMTNHRAFGFQSSEHMETTHEHDDGSIRVNPCNEAVDLSIRVRPISGSYEADISNSDSETDFTIITDVIEPENNDSETVPPNREEMSSDIVHTICDTNDSNTSRIGENSTPASNVLPECIDLTGDFQKETNSPYTNLKRAASLSDLTSDNDAEKLNPRQCKEILAKHRVTYKGICEKAELVAKVRQLWKDVKANKFDDAPMADEQLCCICMENPKDCVMLECGHMCSCTDCGKQMNECPICREYVVRVVRVFKA